MLSNLSMLARGSFLIALAALAAIGCGTKSNGSGSGGGDTTGGAGGAAPSICADDPRGEPYHPGLSGKATDGAMSVRFVTSNPTPPTRGNNTFTIVVTDKSGKPVDGAQIQTKTYMPDHGHGSSIDPTATADGKPGEYVIDPVNLFMPGIWQITFDVSGKDKTNDSVMFTFCIDG
jgi:YtkA-like